MKSELFKLGSKDLIKGLIMAILSAIMTAVYNAVNANALPTDWVSIKPIVLVGVGAGITYLLKNFVTNSQDQFAKAEPVAAAPVENTPSK